MNELIDPRPQTEIKCFEYKSFSFLYSDIRPWYIRLYQITICIPRYIVTGRMHLGVIKVKL